MTAGLHIEHRVQILLSTLPPAAWGKNLCFLIQICFYKDDATDLLSLTANVVRFGGLFSAHFPRKEGA